jgi:hypothetical protein
MSFLETITHLFFPHHTNNHRPKVLHIDALAVYLVFFLVINIIFRFGRSTMPDVLGYASDIYVDQLLAITNEKRAENGLSALTINSQLGQAAQLKAQNMFSENYWAHNSPSGKTPWDFINSSGYRYTIAGENLAKNFMSSRNVVDAWMASPSHRENLLKPGYKEIGFAIVNGVINGEETTLVVQMFGTSVAAVAQKPAVVLDEGKAIVKEPVEVKTLSKVVEKELIDTSVKSKTITKAAEVDQNLQNRLAINPPGSTLHSTTDNKANGISIHPEINIYSLGKYLIYGFIILMFVVLISDAYIVSRKKIVRVTGHNFAHFLFFSALFIITYYAYNGAII